MGFKPDLVLVLFPLSNGANTHFIISPLLEDTISSTTDTSIVSSFDSDRRCRKKAKIADTDVEEEEDKISRLPDAILCNILSSFSTKETVRTSILSKRWRYVWTSVPNLVFNDSEFLHDKERSNTLDTKNCFVNFINRVLHLHNVSCIQKFHLFVDNDYGMSSVSAWINTTISRDVEEIDVEVCLIEDVELSRSFFTSKKLVVLKLDSSFFLNVPTSVNFPNLKIMHLNRVKFADDDSVKNLVSGCPVLEELDMNTCDYENVRTLCIQSSTLKKLRVRLVHNNSTKRDFEHKLVIESPKLQYLDLTEFATEDCNVNFLSSLVEVHLVVTPFIVARKNVFKSRFIKLLRNISNVKHLELDWIEMSFSISPDFGNLPVFLNLTCLKLIVSEYCWDILPFLLELSPNLRTCHVGKMEDDYTPCECQWESPNCIPKCLLLSLEKIVITGFEACEDEIEMVEYFLKNGRVLKKMLIESVKLRRIEKSKLRKKLLTFPKASKTCKISLS